MSQQQRIQIDAATAHIASTASLASQRMSQSFEGSSNQAGAVAVQLAAMKALLASVLSPASHRPAFLPQALNLFTQVPVNLVFALRFRFCCECLSLHALKHLHGRACLAVALQTETVQLVGGRLLYMFVHRSALCYGRSCKKHCIIVLLRGKETQQCTADEMCTCNILC